MYGCNKLYCEQLGRYYARHYKQLAAERAAGRVDFRCLRFPGLISAMTVPAGGTSDYAPEMIHAAAQGEPYACFVRPDTRIPFMAMPDGIDALLALAAAPRERLTRTAYNVRAFNPSAEEMRAIVLDAFPGADDQLPGRREAAGHRRFLAGRRRRRRRPPRLGLRPALRPRLGLHRLPDPHHRRPLPPALNPAQGPPQGPARASARAEPGPQPGAKPGAQPRATGRNCNRRPKTQLAGGCAAFAGTPLGGPGTARSLTLALRGSTGAPEA